MLATDSATPLYLQLKALLREAIESGRLQYGQKIPTEAELSTQYAVSRVTVRKATAALVAEGLLARQQGKGTFVSGVLQQNLIDSAPVSWTADNQSRHHMPQTRCVALSTVLGPTVEDAFGLEAGQNRQYCRALRLRLLDDRPLLCENDYFPYPEYAFLTPTQLNGSVFALLRRVQGIAVLQAQETVIRVVKAPPEYAALLEIAAGEAVVHTRTAYCHPDGRVAFLSEQFINSEKYQIKTQGRTVVL